MFENLDLGKKCISLELLKTDNDNLLTDNLRLHSDFDSVLKNQFEAVESKDLLKFRDSSNKEIIRQLDARKAELESDNRKLKEKCYSSGKLINELGYQTAELKERYNFQKL